MAQLDNLAFADVVKNGIVDNIALQKHFMATGLSKDSIQESLKMIVSGMENGKLSDAAVRLQLDTKINYSYVLTPSHRRCF